MTVISTLSFVSLTPAQFLVAITYKVLRKLYYFESLMVLLLKSMLILRIYVKYYVLKY